MKIIELQDVSFRYEGRQKNAVSDISLEFEKGEFVLILGATGAGKSTLLRLLNGLIPHFYKGEFKGRVLVDGVDTREATVAELARHVGLVFQNPENQLVALTVERELAFGLENLGMPREEMRRRITHYLNVLGIEHLRDRVLYNLSGGERHLIALASVVIMEPKVLVLDEPTSELDPYNSWILVNTIKNLHDRGKTIIVAEHRVELLAKFATRVVVMKDGIVVKEGSPEEILYNTKLLNECRIRVPRVVEIWNELKNRGIEIEPTLDEDSFLRSITGVVGDRDS